MDVRIRPLFPVSIADARTAVPRSRSIEGSYFSFVESLEQVSHIHVEARVLRCLDPSGFFAFAPRPSFLFFPRASPRQPSEASLDPFPRSDRRCLCTWRGAVMADVRLGATRLLPRARPRAAFLPYPHRYLSLEVSISPSRSPTQGIDCAGEAHRPPPPRPSPSTPSGEDLDSQSRSFARGIDGTPFELSEVLSSYSARAGVAARTQPRSHSRACRGGETDARGRTLQARGRERGPNMVRGHVHEPHGRDGDVRKEGREAIGRGLRDEADQTHTPAAIGITTYERAVDGGKRKLSAHLACAEHQHRRKEEGDVRHDLHQGDRTQVFEPHLQESRRRHEQAVRDACDNGHGKTYDRVGKTRQAERRLTVVSDRSCLRV